MAQSPQWRGQPDTRRRLLRTLVVLSVLLHVPFTPLGALVGLLAFIETGAPEEVPAEQLEGIPVTLLSEEELAALGGARPPEPPAKQPEPAEQAAEPALPDPDEALDELFEDPDPTPAPKPSEKPREADEPKDGADGGAPEPGDAGGEPRAAQTAPEGLDAGKAAPAPKPGKVPDPGALAGKAASVTDANANVKLFLFNDRIAKHPVGPRVGALLRRVPQWRSFFGPSGLDPIRDIRRVFVAGPQFRESAEVVAVLEHRVTEAEMKKAIDAIVQREPKGEWLDTKVPAARARADRAERIFVLANPGIVVMAPPHLQDDTIEKAPTLGFPNLPGDAAVIAFIKTPWRVLIGLQTPVTIPKSISTLSVQVAPAPGGSVEVRLRAIDGSPEEARRHASALERAINMVTQRDVGALGALLLGSGKIQLIEPVELHTEGEAIVGTAKATPRQIDRMLNFLESWLDAIDNRARIRERKSDKGLTVPPPPAPAPAPARSAPAPR